MTTNPSASPRQDAIDVAHSTSSDRIEHLLIARESDTQDLPMLEAMILQTLGKYPHLPGHATLLELAATPVSNPDVVRHVEHREGDTRAFEFEVDGTVCLYSRGTAAGRDVKGDNGFSRIVRRLLLQFKPDNLYVATFSRLVRSHYFAHDIFQILSDHRITLHDGSSTPIKCWTPEGRLRWQMLVMFVDMEREAILTRLTLGTLARHRRGEWIQTYLTVPFGYRLVNKRLVADPDAHNAVNKVIRLIGTPGLDMHEVMRALGDIGVSSPIDETGWGYDKSWRWDGRDYVPERYRHSASQNAQELVPTGSTRSDPTEDDDDTSQDVAHDGAFDIAIDANDIDNIEDVAETTQADVPDHEPHQDPNGDAPLPRRRLIHENSNLSAVAQRLIRYLDLWETGTLQLRLRSPLDVDNYADYTVTRKPENPNDYGYIELDYRPEPPLQPWATPEQFSAARAAVEHRLARADRRTDSAHHRLPFLGQVGRWTHDGHAYALLSPPGGGRRPTYILYSQPAQPPQRTANGARIRMHWKTHGRYAKHLTKVLTVDASDLHTAVSKAAVTAFNDGLSLSPAPEAPPSFLGGDTPRQRIALRRRIAECEDKAERFLDTASAVDTAPEYAEFCHRRAQEHIAQAAQYRDELEVIDRRTSPTLPTEITIDARLITGVLAGLQTCVGRVHSDTAHAIRDVITNFRITRVGPLAEFRFDLRLPAEDGVVLAGPVIGRLPQSLGSDQPGDLDPSTRAAIQSERSKELARLLLTTDMPVRATIGADRASTGAAEAERAHSYLVRQGLTPAAARAALSALPLVTRQTIWAVAHGEPTDPSLDPAFVARIEETYLRPGTVPSTGSSWLKENVVQQAIHAQASQLLTFADFKEWLTSTGLGPTAHQLYIRKSEAHAAHRLGKEVSRIVVTEEGAKVVAPLSCPHCPDGTVDTWAKVHENAQPILCSTCRRSPEPDSPVYPTEYLSISVDEARQRVLAVNPVVQHAPPGFIVSVEVSRRIFAWAADQQLWSGDRRVVSKSLIERYYVAIAEGRVEDPGAIRDWAERVGIASGSRGRLAHATVDKFITRVLDRNRGPVRDWAAAQGRVFPRGTADRHQLMLDYAAHVREAHRLDRTGPHQPN